MNKLIEKRNKEIKEKEEIQRKQREANITVSRNELDRKLKLLEEKEKKGGGRRRNPKSKRKARRNHSRYSRRK